MLDLTFDSGPVPESGVAVIEAMVEGYLNGKFPTVMVQKVHHAEHDTAERTVEHTGRGLRSVKSASEMPVAPLTPEDVEVGDGATISTGGDRYAYTVVERSKSGLSIWLTRDDMKRVDNNGPHSESQEYVYKSTPDNGSNRTYARWHKKNGRYYVVGTKRVVSAGRRAHLDPHF
jgi:hypothetical protein